MDIMTGLIQCKSALTGATLGSRVPIRILNSSTLMFTTSNTFRRACSMLRRTASLMRTTGSRWFTTSVLTHLLPDAACQYLKETSRVLKLGGRSVVTFFIINDGSRRHMMSSGLCFQPTERGYWTTQPDYPEAAIAFEEEKVLTMYEKAGLEIQTPIRYGNWSGRDGLVGGQDHVLAIKR
jgi:hypothetical protein